MKFRLINCLNIIILVVSILTIFSCSSQLHRKKSKDLKEVALVVKDSLATNQSTTVFDTTQINAIDEMIILSPKADLMGQSVKIIPLDLPLKSDSIQYGSYWIGVGDSNHDKYKLLEQTIPRTWAKPGVTIPLGAYALGKPVTLPENANQPVHFMIGTREETAKVMSQSNGGIPTELQISAFQEKFALPITEQEKLYLLMNNQDRISAHKINVKFIATLIRENKK